MQINLHLKVCGNKISTNRLQRQSSNPKSTEEQLKPKKQLKGLCIFTDED